LVSSAVVWIRNAPPPTGHHVSFTFGGSLLQPQVARDVSVDSLRNTPKWTRFSSIDDVHRCGEPGRLVLSDLFKIQRGVATGANDFFLLTPERVAEYQIPAQFLKPILPSPRSLLSDEIQSGEDGLPLVERPLFLLSCDLPESLVESEYPSLWKYFQYGVELGISKRYLATHRSPWYAQEERRPAPFLCTYMGRTANGRAFRFILNHSRAIAANVYLMLYPRPVLHQQLADVVVRRNVWRALNAITPEHIIGEGRVYGGGLHKIEPRELGNASADDIVAVIPGLRIPTSKQTSLFHV
jgi:hypothetical protein